MANTEQHYSDEIIRAAYKAAVEADPPSKEMKETGLKRLFDELGIKRDELAPLDGQERGTTDIGGKAAALPEPDKRLILDFAEGEECSMEDLLTDGVQTEPVPDGHLPADGFDHTEAKMDEEEFDER